MLQKISDISIKMKIVGVFAIMLILISIFIITYFPNQQKAQITLALEDKVESLAEMVAFGIGVGMGASDYEAITIAFEWAKQDENLAYIIVLNTDGEEFASHNPDEISINEKNFLQKGGVFEWNDMLNTVVPIEYKGNSFGSVVLGFSLRELKNQISRISLTTLLISFIILVIGVAISFAIGKLITRPISYVVDMIKDMAEGEGDLTVRLDASSKDEIGELSRWFNKFVEKLRGIIAQIKQSAGQIGSASEQISSASEQLASGSEEQQAQLSEVATSMEEMSAMVLEASKNAGETKDNAQQANDAAREGRQTVLDTVSGIEGIAGIVNTAAEQINALEERSGQIGEVIQVINDIADQTNLLALNANIEAARAGDAGRGFAVVADEVRKLAERTVNATTDIGEQIKQIQTDVSSSVEAMSRITEESKKGQELAGKSGEALETIANVISNVDNAVTQIAAGADEQSSGIEEISRNIESVSTVAKQAASSAQEMASSAQQLNGEVQGLNDLVAQFKV